MSRPVYQPFIELLRLSQVVRGLINKALMLDFVFELVKIIPPMIFKYVIDNMITYDPAKGISIALIVWLLGGYLVSMLVMSLFEMLQTRLLIMNILDAEVDIVGGALKKLLSLDVGYHESNNTGGHLSRIFKGGGRIVDLLFNLIQSVIPIFFQTLITLVMLMWSGWQVGLVFMLFVPLFVFVVLKEAKITHFWRERLHEEWDEFAGVIAQSIINIRTVKDFSNEDLEISKGNVHIKKYSEVADKRNWVGTLGLGVEDLLISVARVVTLGLGIWLMINQKITPGSLVFIVTLSEKAYINLQRLGRVYFMMQDAEPAITRFSKIKKEPVTITDSPNSPFMIDEGSITFQDVTFAYRKGDAALKEVSFEIPARSVVALVGRSGSGKSTAVKLVLRHHDPTKGTVLIDGRELKAYSFKNLRRGISIVSQDVELFNESVFDNIAYGVKGATMQDVVKAAKLAHAHEFIIGFDKGYHTLIGERGVRLSGGQKQRLAIARALIRKPKILIFDEATSSLDAESEKCIHEAIVGLMGKVTLIIIAHRFATIERADKIILLEQGRVKEIGTHKELMRKRGIFAKLRKLQELGDVK